MSKVRIGLIGCGGRQGAHIDALMKMDDVQIVALAEPVKERREAAAAKTGARAYETHKELYDSESKKNAGCGVYQH
ncbi:MAG: Gfo/Idh/MocA family oxidoreductase [Christensenellales bacterium]|jgi:predicted dehydrogenase